MNESAVTEIFGKLMKQCAQADALYGAMRRDRTDLSIRVRSPTDAEEDDADSAATKLRILMHVKHIERHMSSLKEQVDATTGTVRDVPPYSVSLDIVDPDAGPQEQEPEGEEDLDRLIEDIYDTLNVDDSPGTGSPHDPPGVGDPFDEDEDDSNCRPHEGSQRADDSSPSAVPDDESDDDELEVSEIEIDNVRYYTTDERSGKIYHVLANNDIGEKVGVFDEGVATFY